MATRSYLGPERRRLDPTVTERYEAGHPLPLSNGNYRSLGLGLITGASDDDPSAIGTYAAAGASFGPAFLWTAPATFPMMFAVVYLCSKLGQVAGQGLFAVIATDNYLHVVVETVGGDALQVREGRDVLANRRGEVLAFDKMHILAP